MALFTIHCSLLISPARAQVGTWRAYMAYYEPQQIVKAGNLLFVRASNDLYQYNLNDHSITTYDKVNGLSDTYINHIAWNQQAGRLIIVYQNANIDLMDQNGNVTNVSALYRKTMTEDKTIDSLTIDGVYAYLYARFGIVKVNMQRAEISDTYTKNHPEYPTQLPTTDFTADWNQYIDVVRTLKPDGPKYNYFGFMKYENDRLYTCEGESNGQAPIGAVQIYDGDWEIYQDEFSDEETKTFYPYGAIDYCNTYCMDYDPTDISHVFVGARNGLYEFRNGQLVNFYNSKNSPIEPYDGKSMSYQLITGVKFDAEGSLWFMNSQAPTKSLIKLSKDGTFTPYTISELMKLSEGGISNKSLGDLSDMRFDANGHLWFVNNNWSLASFYRYDVNTGNIITFNNFVNQDGTTIESVYGVACTVEDNDGNIWVATDKGPLLLEKSQIEANSPVFTQVKVPRNDGTDYADYLLSGVEITAIAIDGGGRKWFGTNGNGAYLISKDNLTQVEHFTTENSKLLSDNIQSIAINNDSGEVFFGTDQGLCSYISNASTANTEMTKDNVYAYPNPVTPDYEGLITVVGLTMDADVKILTSSGKLVAQGRSNGGTFTWDGHDKNGKRVASGVYMVVTATSDGNKGTVCKIAIIK